MQSDIGALTDEEFRIRLLVLSALIGAAATFVAFVLLLQTAAVSFARLALAVILLVVTSLIHYWLSLRWWRQAQTVARARAPRAAMIGLALTAIFLPLLCPSTPYPLSPLLRPWADLAVQFELPADSPPLVLESKDLRLIIGKEVLDASAFNIVGNWERTTSGLRLGAGSTGSLQWTGTVPETITLSLQPPAVDGTLTVYWNNLRTSTQLHRAYAEPILIVEKSATPWGYNLALFLSCAILVAWMLAVIILLLGGRLSLLLRLGSSKAFLWGMLVLCIALAMITVKLQIDSLAGGTQYLTTTQLIRHNNVLQGLAPNPWQYRPLSEWTAELLLRVSRLLSLPQPVEVAFIFLRVVQNVTIFLLAFALYKRLTHSSLLALLGMLVLASSIKNAYYDNDLAFNTYFDVLFYLACGLLLLSRKYYAGVILALFAALNRETSGIIPFLMAAAIWQEDHRPGLRMFVPALLAVGVFASVFVGLRLLDPGRPLYIPYKHPPGADLLLYNVTREFTWGQLWRTLGLAPLLGVIFVASWPRLWRQFLLILCPIWFVLHAVASVMAETRLFLVPQALVFIPGALFMLSSLAESRDIIQPQSI